MRERFRTAPRAVLFVYLLAVLISNAIVNLAPDGETILHLVIHGDH